MTNNQFLCKIKILKFLLTCCKWTYQHKQKWLNLQLKIKFVHLFDLEQLYLNIKHQSAHDTVFFKYLLLVRENIKDTSKKLS